MLEQQNRDALVQICSLQFCPQFFQGENTQAARPHQFFFLPSFQPKMFPLPFSLFYIYFFSSSLKSTQPNITLVFNAPPLIIHVGNAIIFQIEKEKKFRRKKRKTNNNKETREERHKITSCNILLKWLPTFPISNQYLMFLLQGLPLIQKNGSIPACQVHLQTRQPVSHNCYLNSTKALVSIESMA